ncbi:MAG: glycosyltransferase [Clostridia bacterium]|nr:glycosyltransferase [Clostridia bacterium]
MRVLHLYADPHLTHGAAIFEYRIAQQLKDDGIIFDYLFSKKLLPEDAQRYAQNGSRVYDLDVDEKLNLIAHEIRANIAYYKFFKTHDYKIVYADTENALRAVHLLMARLAGVPVRVLHSHNTQLQTRSRLSHLIARVLRHVFRFSATHYFACSDLAAQWLFPPSICRRKDYKVLQNGVDLTQFRFNPQIRSELRAKLGICDDQLLLGHVGRFMPQKNHSFLLEIFAGVVEKKPDARLMLIGDGANRAEAERKAKELGIEDKVLFIGSVQNVSDYLQAMDMFIMPSLFEGLPVTGIEAQAASLPCIFSDTITRELAITSLAEYLPIDSIDPWVERICRADATLPRQDVEQQIIQAGYSIDHTAAQLREFYFKHGGSECL